MHVAVWVLQVLLAALYVLHGLPYVAPPRSLVERMRQRRPGRAEPALSPGIRRVIGIAEWLASAGLILPGLTGVLPWLTPLAAAGLMVVTYACWRVVPL